MRCNSSREHAFLIVHHHHLSEHEKWASCSRRILNLPWELRGWMHHSLTSLVDHTASPHQRPGPWEAFVEGGTGDFTLAHQTGSTHVTGHTRVLHRMCASVHCDGHLVGAEQTLLPLFNRELENSRLLVDIWHFIFKVAANAMHACTRPTSQPSLLRFADGVSPCAPGKVNLQVAIIDCPGVLPPINIDAPRQIVLVTSCEMLQACNTWLMDGRVVELIVRQISRLSFAVCVPLSTWNSWQETIISCGQKCV